MGKVTIQKFTTKEPITMIGYEAGVCCEADTSDDGKNYKRGIDCIESQHGRTFEFPDVYLTIEGYSARVIREWYTHIGGLPTRLQASTRYINYNDFSYIIPHKIEANEQAKEIYTNIMGKISDAGQALEELGVPREDSALVLPLGMKTKIVCKHNMRNLIDMSRQRMCNRAYWEYREMFHDLCTALSEYSEQWAYIVKTQFMPKCEYIGYCPEKKGCGRMHGKVVNNEGN